MYLEISGDVGCSELFVSGDVLAFTDGSFVNDNLGYAFCIFSEADCRFPIFEYQALLTPHKTILDAEATALICGLEAAIALPQEGTIYLISDSRAALKMFRLRPTFVVYIAGAAGCRGRGRVEEKTDPTTVF